MASVTDCKKRQTDSQKETYSFTLLLAGFDSVSDEIENALYNGGCDDALLGIAEGQPYLTFDRQADSLADAIRSAIADAEKPSLHIKVIKVVPPGEHIISLINSLLSLRNEFDLPDVQAQFANFLAEICRR